MREIAIPPVSPYVVEIGKLALPHHSLYKFMLQFNVVLFKWLVGDWKMEKKMEIGREEKCFSSTRMIFGVLIPP